MAGVSVKQVLASLLFGVAAVSALILGLILMLAVRAPNTSPLVDLWCLVVIVSPLVAGFVRAKYQATFDRAGNRALLALGLLSIVVIHLAVTLGAYAWSELQL